MKLDTPFWIIFSISIVSSMIILLYWARKNPNPRFRPRIGELLTGALFLVLISGGLSIGFSNLLQGDITEEAGRNPGYGKKRAAEPEPEPEDED